MSYIIVGKVGGAYVLIERPKVDTIRRFVCKKALRFDRLVYPLFFKPLVLFFGGIKLFPSSHPPIYFPTSIKNMCHRSIKRPIRDTDDTYLKKTQIGEKHGQ